MENCSPTPNGVLSKAAAFSLPSDLDSLSLSTFDNLVTKGEIIYEPSTSETVEDQGFKVSEVNGTFSITRMLWGR